MFVSIVIATRNRSVLLARTLDALARQRWPADRLEIIVADNGSTDDTRAVVEDAAKAGTRELHLVQEDVHDAVAGLVYEKLRRRPMIVPVVVEV